MQSDFEIMVWCFFSVNFFEDSILCVDFKIFCTRLNLGFHYCLHEEWAVLWRRHWCPSHTGVHTCIPWVREGRGPGTVTATAPGPPLFLSQVPEEFPSRWRRSSDKAFSSLCVFRWRQSLKSLSIISP